MGPKIAAIFDFDGVIVNTIGSLYQIYTSILESFGATGTPAEFNLLNGSHLGEIVSHLAQQHQLIGREAEIKKKFEDRFSHLYDKVELMPGVPSVLESIKKQGAVIGLASAATRANIDSVLRQFNLTHFFDFIVSGNEVTKAKPDPEIYALALTRSKCDENFVIEDSPNGIEAARCAGLIAIQYISGSEPKNQRASYHVTNLADTLKIIFNDKAIILSKATQIELTPDDTHPVIQPQDKSHVDEIWNNAVAKNPSLFNDKVASYKSHRVSPNGKMEINCFPSEYKYIFARLQDSKIKNMSPMGVSGIVIDSTGKVLLGKRGKGVSEYKEHYEFVPSGGIAISNMNGTKYLNQIKCELTEETGLELERIKDAAPFTLIYDRAHGVYDICVKLTLDGEVDTNTLTSKEYTSFVLLNNDSLQQFIREEPIVPISEAIFQAMFGH